MPLFHEKKWVLFTCSCLLAFQGFSPLFAGSDSEDEQVIDGPADKQEPSAAGQDEGEDATVPVRKQKSGSSLESLTPSEVAEYIRAPSPVESDDDEEDEAVPAVKNVYNSDAKVRAALLALKDVIPQFKNNDEVIRALRRHIKIHTNVDYIEFFKVCIAYAENVALGKHKHGKHKVWDTEIKKYQRNYSRWLKGGKWSKVLPLLAKYFDVQLPDPGAAENPKTLQKQVVPLQEPFFWESAEGEWIKLHYKEYLESVRRNARFERPSHVQELSKILEEENQTVKAFPVRSKEFYAQKIGELLRQYVTTLPYVLALRTRPFVNEEQSVPPPSSRKRLADGQGEGSGSRGRYAAHASLRQSWASGPRENSLGAQTWGAPPPLIPVFPRGVTQGAPSASVDPRLSDSPPPYMPLSPRGVVQGAPTASADPRLSDFPPPLIPIFPQEVDQGALTTSADPRLSDSPPPYMPLSPRGVMKGAPSASVDQRSDFPHPFAARQVSSARQDQGVSFGSLSKVEQADIYAQCRMFKEAVSVRHPHYYQEKQALYQRIQAQYNLSIDGFGRVFSVLSRQEKR